MNLPGAIEALETPSGIPQALEEKRKSVQTEVACYMDLVVTLLGRCSLNFRAC
jgi:hypothetical protein